jgi:hypothetical protein
MKQFRIERQVSMARTAALLALLSTASAFLPPQPTSTSLRLNSLADQLSQLSYDGAFSGKVSAAVKSSASSAAATVAPAPDKVSFSAPNVQEFLKDIKFDLPSMTLPDSINIPQVELPPISLDSLPPSFKELESAIEPFWTQLQQTIPALSNIDAPPAPALLLLSSLLTYSLISTLLTYNTTPPPSSPYPMGKYDAISARRYFDSRPLEVLKRGLEVTLLSGAFLIALASDWIRGKLDENAEERAVELSVLLTRLGPSFIKVCLSLCFVHMSVFAFHCAYFLSLL